LAIVGAALKKATTVQQLGGIDNLMILGELPNIPLHMSALMIYETGGKRGADRLYQALLEKYETVTLSQFPILRCRIEALPLHMDKSYWVEDPNFRLTYHFTRVSLPKGKGWGALYRLFGQFHAQPLDQSRPLWEVMFVEGLDQLDGVPRGCSALFLKIHHSVFDGKSALKLISSLHSLSPEPGSPTLADSMPAPDNAEGDFRSPSALVKYSRAWWHSVERPFGLVSILAKILPRILNGGDEGNTKKEQPVPQLRFNHPLAPDRIIGHARMEMKQLRKLEKKHHCTINDIALCVIAGALRGFLLENDELPEENLRAFMPIDIRRKGEDGSFGNHVSMSRISLYTALEDDLKRLRAICSGSSRAKKKRSDKSAAHDLLKLADELPPAILLWLGGWLISSGRIDKLPQTANTVITNVPGISSEAYMAGAKLIDYLGFGPLAPNMGLFHTVSSTQDHVNISFLSTAEFLQDGDNYRVSLEQSWKTVSAL
jgi:diacylglycerol O-acyltransferase